MKLLINGKEESLLSEMTLAELISQRGLNPKSIIVEYNFELVTEENWSQIKLHESDRIEILRFVGGG
ncbi:MAG: sulfur carrier protein ThiS [Syntrophomonadaceae bacterium]|nr:sulfur carrier protein ThiS [Syntrophomonadaceae bacterium]